MKKITYTATVIGAVLLFLATAAGTAHAKADLGPAQTAVDEGRFQEAVDLLTAMEKDDPRNHKLFILLGDAYTGLSDWDNAETAYARAVKLKGGDLQARLKWGQVYGAMGQTDEAVKKLEAGLDKAKKDPEKAMFNAAIGRVLLDGGECTPAQEYLLKATILDDVKPQYHLDLGDAYFDCQVYSLAKIEYETVLRNDPGNCLALYRIGVAHFRDRQFTNALESFGKAHLCDTTYIPVFYDLALLYVLSARSQGGDQAVEYYQNALYYFERYRAAWPDSNKVLVAKNVSLAYYYLRDYEKAVEELARAIDVGVDDPELLFLLGRSLQLLERYGEAVTRFDEYEAQLTDADTASGELYSRRALCRLGMTQQDSTLKTDSEWLLKIVDDYNLAINRDSNDVRSISQVASLLDGKVLNRHEESKWYFDRLTEISPNEARYWFNAALPRLKLGQELEAMELLFKAMELDQSEEGQVRATAREIVSPILLKSGRYEQARDFYKTLISQDPNNCSNLQWYAFTFYAAAADADPSVAPGKYQLALPHLEKAYNCMARKNTSKCKMRDIMLWLAQCYTQLSTSDWDKAKPLINAGLECDPNDKEFKELQRMGDDVEEYQYTPGQKVGGQK